MSDESATDTLDMKPTADGGLSASIDLDHGKEAEAAAAKEAERLAWMKDLDLTDEQKKGLSKFGSKEEALKGYLELQSKMGQPKPAEDAAGKPAEDAGKDGRLQLNTPDAPDTKDLPSSTDPDFVMKAIDKAGLKFDELATHFNEHGRISDDQMGAFEKLGYTKNEVNLAIHNFALSRQVHNQVMESAISKAADAVGGQERLNELMKWGGQQPDSAQVNKGLADKDTLVNTVIALNARYEKALADGTAKKQTTAGDPPIDPSAPGGATKMPGFNSQKEMMDFQQKMGRQPSKEQQAEYRQRLANTSDAVIDGVPA